MTKEQRELIEDQISQHQHIVWDLCDEIDYHENEIRNLKDILKNDSPENTINNGSNN